MTTRLGLPILLVCGAFIIGAAGCRHAGVAHPTPLPAPATGSLPAPSPAATEKPVAPEKNPPGDIPDSQVFITYHSTTGGYVLDVPEGWARSVSGTNVKFVDKYDGEQVILTRSTTAPTVSSIRSEQVPALQQHSRAVKIQQVKTITMPHGYVAIAVVYTANSDPNLVTGKQIRLDNTTYYYFHQGKLAALTVWAPAGADNVDQWKRISASFRWR